MSSWAELPALALAVAIAAKRERQHDQAETVGHGARMRRVRRGSAAGNEHTRRRRRRSIEGLHRVDVHARQRPLVRVAVWRRCTSSCLCRCNLRRGRRNAPLRAWRQRRHRTPDRGSLPRRRLPSTSSRHPCPACPRALEEGASNARLVVRGSMEEIETFGPRPRSAARA